MYLILLLHFFRKIVQGLEIKNISLFILSLNMARGEV
jgi:hypothetical protein